MARNQKPDQITYKGYAQCPLEDDEFAAIEKASLNETACIMSLHQMVNDSYSITLSYDESKGAFIAAAMCKDGTKVWAGFMLSGQSDTIFGAIACLLYKHLTKMEKNWLPFLEQRSKSQKFR